MDWYVVTRWGMTSVGLVCAGYFCVTWTPRAMRERGVGGWAMLDTAGWVWSGFILLLLSAAAQLTGPIEQPATALEYVRRLGTFAFIDFIIIVRAVRWWSFQRDLEICATCGRPNARSGWRRLRPWRHGPGSL